MLDALLALRDAGEALPVAGVCISPWVDLACSGASFEKNAAFDFVGAEHCRLAAASYRRGRGVCPTEGSACRITVSRERRPLSKAALGLE